MNKVTNLLYSVSFESYVTATLLITVPKVNLNSFMHLSAHNSGEIANKLVELVTTVTVNKRK